MRDCWARVAWRLAITAWSRPWIIYLSTGRTFAVARVDDWMLPRLEHQHLDLSLASPHLHSTSATTFKKRRRRTDDTTHNHYITTSRGPIYSLSLRDRSFSSSLDCVCKALEEWIDRKCRSLAGFQE